MNGVHHNFRKHDFEKMYPGCLGRMNNLFESNTGKPANRLLDDKPHRADSMSGVSVMSPSGDPRDSDFNNTVQNRKFYVTPMKTLIAQEMSTEEDPKGVHPNLVAKLMGIDIFPQYEPGSITQRSHSRTHVRSHLDIPTNKDVHEGWKQSPKSQHKGKYEEETMNDREMNLIRQKFVEAKCLSMDEKLRQSKQFHDALDVLSSNKDLFPNCLHEPNLKDLYSFPPETNRITVLRPSTVTNGNNNDSARARYRDEQQINRGTFLGPNKPEKTHPGTSPGANLESGGNSTQPTRIVVLKPKLRKPQNNGKAMGSRKCGLPHILLGEGFSGDEEDDECREAREVAKEITQQIHEKLGMHRRDETLISSVFSNGYVGDESSFNRSETEVMSPVSRRSWDYADRISSPYSSSLHTRASYSSESSVCREAKKRLSERWATMASSSSESFQEQILFQRSLSTLGDMLALSEIKKEACTSEEPENLDAHLDIEHRIREENVDYSPENLIRSKSLPVSNKEFETRVNEGISVSDKRKPEFLKDTKGKIVKSSFRGKVSSLFFLRNKDSVINKSSASCVDETHLFSGEFCNEKGLDCATPGLLELNRIDKQGMVSPESASAVAERIASAEARGNHDKPSLVSLLNTSLKENEHTAKVLPHYVNPHDRNGIERPLTSIRQNLIDKSPPIESIARTQTHDTSCVDKSAPHPLSETLTDPKTDEYQECFFLLKTLLSMSGLQGTAAKPNSFSSRWYSPESPLDPSLRDSYINALNDKQWQNRSSQKFMFDCVNEVLIDIAEYELDSGLREIGPGSCVLDEVWARMKECFTSQDECVLSGDGDEMVERVVRKEVMGKVWNSHFRSEIDDWRAEIGGKLLEELVQETIVELTGMKSDWNAFSF